VQQLQQHGFITLRTEGVPVGELCCTFSATTMLYATIAQFAVAGAMFAESGVSCVQMFK
jgi:hypothetical protein